MSGAKYLLAGFLLILGVLIAKPAYAQPYADRVILISVGGLNYENYSGSNLPHLKQLAYEGVTTEKTLAVRADTLESAEASLLTGALPDDHKYISAQDKLETASFLDSLKKYGKTFLVVDGSGGKLAAFNYGEKEYFSLEADASSKTVLETAFEQMNKYHPFFVYVYINDIHLALMKQDQKAYYASLQNFDLNLGSFIKKLKDFGYYDRSLLIITSARSSSSSNLVPFLMRGPQCKTNTTIKSSLILDVIPTLSLFFNISPPPGAIGVPMYGAMAADESQQVSLMRKWIADYQKDRLASWNKRYELQNELDKTLLRMASIREENEAIFHFADEREQVIDKLRNKITWERIFWLGLTALMGIGYIIEYHILKRRFLLFK